MCGGCVDVCGGGQMCVNLELGKQDKMAGVIGSWTLPYKFIVFSKPSAMDMLNLSDLFRLV